MKKKFLAIMLCLTMALSVSACSKLKKKNTGTSDTEKLDRYSAGFFTKDAYYNESAGIKFTCPKEGDFKFDSVKNVIDFSAQLAGSKVEALCRSNASVVAFLNVKVGYTSDMDKSVDEILKTLNNSSATSKFDIEDANSKAKGKDVNLAGKEYRQINMKATKSGQDIEMDLYLRMIGNKMFIIETSNIKALGEEVDLEKCIAKLDDKEDLDKLEDESKKYAKELDKQEEEAKKDPAMDQAGIYTKGTKTSNGYTNISAKFEFKCPNGVKTTSLLPQAEFCALTTGKPACVTYISSEYIGKTYNVDEYVKAFTNTLTKTAKSAKVISSDKTETLAGQTWRYVESEVVTADGQNTISKSYIRLIGDKAVVISFQHTPGDNANFEKIKSGYIATK